MKHCVLLLIFFSIYQFIWAQNVGIGTTNPETKLKVEGAVSYKVETIPAANAIVIPENVSIAYITNNAAVSLNNTTANNPKEGQLLTIYNADAEAVNFSGELINALSGVATFTYINGNWRLTAKNNAGWNLTGNVATTASTTNPVLNQKANNNFIGTTDDKDLVFTTNGYERMRIKTAADGILGKIGIGTSAPAGKLSIVENEDNLIVPALKIEENNDGGAIEIIESGDGSGLAVSSTGTGFGVFSNLYGSVSVADNIGHYFLDNRTYSGGLPGSKIGLLLENITGYNGNNIGLLVNVAGGNTNTAGIFDGNVGVGSFNKDDVPQALLDLKTSNTVPSSTSPGMLNIMSTETGGAADLGGSLSFGGYRNSTSQFSVFGTLEGRKENSLTSSGRGYLSFKTNGETSLVERMRIDGYGKVGIGTSAPMARLEVSFSDIVTTNSTPGILNVMTNETGGAADIGGSISLGGYRSTATNSEFRVYGTIEGRKSISSTTSSSGYLVFKTNNAGILSERMRIFNDGLVRINDLAGSGIRVVTAGADGSLGAVSIGILETDPTWSGTPNITSAITRTGSVGIDGGLRVGSAGTSTKGIYHGKIVVGNNSANKCTACAWSGWNSSNNLLEIQVNWSTLGIPTGTNKTVMLMADGDNNSYNDTWNVALQNMSSTRMDIIIDRTDGGGWGLETLQLHYIIMSND